MSSGALRWKKLHMLEHASTGWRGQHTQWCAAALRKTSITSHRCVLRVRDPVLALQASPASGISDSSKADSPLAANLSAAGGAVTWCAVTFDPPSIVPRTAVTDTTRCKPHGKGSTGQHWRRTQGSNQHLRSARSASSELGLRRPLTSLLLPPLAP